MMSKRIRSITGSQRICIREPDEPTAADITSYLQSSTPADVMQIMLDITKDKEERHTWAPIIPNKDQKDVEHSENLRNYGNTCFQQKKLDEALNSYTKSIAFAPPNSETLALAYSNRAAVLKEQKHFSACIADCQRALAIGSNIQFKVYYRQGMCYEALGQTAKALQCFNRVCEILGVEESLSKYQQTLLDSLQSRLKYLDVEETEEEGEDLTKDPSIGVLKFDVPVLVSPNPELPAASDCIELKYSKVFGRHLVATRDIEIGEVLIVEQPYAAVLIPENFATHCSHCFKISCTLLPCNVCTWAMFCSEACIENSRSYHSIECQKYPGLEQKSECITPLVLRAVITPGINKLATYFREKKHNKNKRTAGFNKNNQFVSTDVSAAANLYFKAPEDPINYFSFGMTVAKMFLQFEFDKLDIAYELGGFILKLCMSLSFNGNGVMEFHKNVGFQGELKALAYSIYPTFCLMNNSCVDNTFYHFYGKTLVLRAGSYIKKGEQILNCCGQSFLKYSKEYRQEWFQNKQYYTCCCKACINNWPTQSGVLPAPGFSNLDMHLHSKYFSLFTLIMKEGIGNTETGWRVTDDTLKYFKDMIQWMDKHDKRHNQMCYIMKECVRVYYNMKGNHVREVEDDGLRRLDASGPIVLEIKTLGEEQQNIEL